MRTSAAASKITPMAEPVDPNAPPMHHEIVEQFAPVHVWIAGFLGVVATVAGVVLGLILVND
jgi:hypothetical protein